jgi:hypothetical protein
MILPSARMMLASVLKSMVRYGCDQSPSTRQTDKVFTLTVNLGGGVFAALGAEFAAVNFSPGLPNSCSTFSSIGRPWQSQPGT